MMEKINSLLMDEEYRSLLRRLEELEAERIFCGHGPEHLLAVARIAWIRNLEEDLGLDRESVYLSALLHDLGRVDEYESGIPHHEAGRERAEYFLNKLEVPLAEQEGILRAIGAHRRKNLPKEAEQIKEVRQTEEVLAALLAWADKASRNCGFCHAYEECKWSREEKDRRLRY